MPTFTLKQLFGWVVYSLQWRRNEHNGVSNHQPHDCLLNRLFRQRSKKISKLCVTGLCVGNSPGTGEFPAQKASNVENVSIWWRHHVSSDRSMRTKPFHGPYGWPTYIKPYMPTKHWYYWVCLSSTNRHWWWLILDHYMYVGDFQNNVSKLWNERWNVSVKRSRGEDWLQKISSLYIPQFKISTFW